MKLAHGGVLSREMAQGAGGFGYSTRPAENIAVSCDRGVSHGAETLSLFLALVPDYDLRVS
jgi:hypothetical protein